MEDVNVLYSNCNLALGIEINGSYSVDASLDLTNLVKQIFQQIGVEGGGAVDILFRPIDDSTTYKFYIIYYLLGENLFDNDILLVKGRFVETISQNVKDFTYSFLNKSLLEKFLKGCYKYYYTIEYNKEITTSEIFESMMFTEAPVSCFSIRYKRDLNNDLSASMCVFGEDSQKLIAYCEQFQPSEVARKTVSQVGDCQYVLVERTQDSKPKLECENKKCFLPLRLPCPKKIRSSSLTPMNSIQLGTTISGNKDIYLPLDVFSRHLSILGNSGTGKTTFLNHVITNLWKEHQVPSIIFDVASGDFRNLLNEDSLKDNLLIFKPGSSEAPLNFNPFALPPIGITVGEYREFIKQLLCSALSLEAPLDGIAKEAIDNIYYLYDYSTFDECKNNNDWPTYRDFLNEFTKISNQRYKGDARANMGGAGQSRLNKLTAIFASCHGIKIEDIVKNPTIIDLSAIEYENRSIIILYILELYYLYLKKNNYGADVKKHTCIIDEAHVLLEASDSKANVAVVEKITRLLAEARKFGLCMILADQRYGVMETVFNLTNTRVVFNTNDGADKIVQEFNIPNVDIINNLTTGEAIISTTDKMSFASGPVAIKTKYKVLPPIANESVKTRMDAYWEKNQQLLKPFIGCKCNFGKCDLAIKAKAERTIYKLNVLFPDKYNNNLLKLVDDDIKPCIEAIKESINIAKEFLDILVHYVCEKIKEKRIDITQENLEKVTKEIIENEFPNIFSDKMKQATYGGVKSRSLNNNL